jgi:peptidoglycan hydrolase-like protein with peptidoglycan-binding domain
MTATLPTVEQGQPPSRPPRRRAAVLAIALVIALAAIGWVAARQIRSPAQIAADTAPPAAAPISVRVDRRPLATKVIVRGTVRYGGRRSVELGSTTLKSGSGVVTDAPSLRATLGPGDVALAVDGRPAFVLPGAIAMHRDMKRGTRGPDVMQLEIALAGLGFPPGRVDGVFDQATQGAVAAFYSSKGYEPFGTTDAQREQLRTAQADAALARDAYLQALNTVEQTRRAATPGDVEQARIDVNTARDQLDTALLAVPTARARLETARRLAATARRLGATAAASSSAREQATADADVALKREALNNAIEEERVATIERINLPLDAPPGDRERAAAAITNAQQAIIRARAELAAGINVANAVRAGTPATLQQARDDAANLATDARLAAAELDRATNGVRVARRQLRLTQLRVRALTEPVDTRTLEAIARSARAEARRTRAVVDRLAAEAGVQLPADEVVFLPQLPVKVFEVKAKRGTTLAGPVMIVTSNSLIIDSSLSISDAELVQVGDRAIVEDQDLGVRTGGRVTEVDTTPGTRKVDPSRFYMAVEPNTQARALVGASVRITIAVTSTRGRVLAVPVSAVSVGGDGSSRVQVLHGNRRELVRVVPGLAADGYVEVRPARGQVLRPGDLVIVGTNDGGRPAGTGP